MSERSYGERAVGLDFNPSSDPVVAHLKQLFAKVIDVCDEGRPRAASIADVKAGDVELARLWEIAIQHVQTAQMWAVKAATWKYAGEDERAP